ncbi:YfhO family protein [Oenococcus oeni]|uniref:YfhO family protein n=1 Tax=Oenococcus oeni TaxID=1247 RepID=UPI000277B291|nr:YfhO family protein [Oenococcus oeni]EJO03054.1 glycosyltransferase [Oenococcus oeni AWRIB318]
MIYTILFVLLIIAIFAGTALTKSSLIWNADGISQHYPALVYWRKILRAWIFYHRSLTSWNWHIGLGQGTIQTFSYYNLGDIFTYPSIFVSQAHLGIYYSIMILVRLYFVGFSFLWAAKRFIPTAKKNSLLIASFTYIFTGYSAYAIFTHPFFLNPLIILPLLAYGLYECLLKNKGWLLALAVAWTIFNNFYFAVLLAFGTFVFWLSLLLSNKRFRVVKNNTKMVISVLIGLLSGSILFLPSFLQLLNSSRTKVPFANGLSFYPLKYYLSLPGVLLTDQNTSYWFKGGFLAISVIAALWTVRRFKKYKSLGYVLIFSSLILLSPIFAAIINDGTSPNNRWSFMLSLPLALATIVFLENLDSVDKKDLHILAILGFVIAISLFIKAGFAFKLVSVLAFYAGSILLICLIKGNKNNLISQKSIDIWLILLTLLNAFMIVENLRSSDLNPKETTLINYATLKQLTKEQKNYQKYINKKNGSRSLIDDQLKNVQGISPADNLSIISPAGNINSYWSLQNKYLGELNQQLENNTSDPNDVVSTIDHRSLLMRYFGVSVFFKNTSDQLAPSEYINTGELVNGQTVYQAKSTVPLIYQSSGTISKSNFSKLAPSQKEVALINNQVEDSGNTIKKKNSTDTQLLSKTFSLPLSLDGKKFATKQKITNKDPLIKPAVSFKIPKKLLNKKYELHLQIDSINYSSGTFKERYSTAVNKYTLSHKQLILRTPKQFNDDLRFNTVLFKMNWLKNNFGSLGNSNEGFSIDAYYNGKSNSFYQVGENDLSFYTPRTKTTLNLGRIKTSSKNKFVTLKLPLVGEYSFKVSLWAVPTGKTTDRAISADKSVSNLVLKKDSVSFTFKAPKTEILSTTIPYSKGWKINKSKKDLPRINTAFIGIPVKKGFNKVVLSYKTPYLSLGMILTIIGLLSLILLAFFDFFKIKAKRIIKRSN